jgi:hypothetical protein
MNVVEGKIDREQRGKRSRRSKKVMREGYKDIREIFHSMGARRMRDAFKA